MSKTNKLVLGIIILTLVIGGIWWGRKGGETGKNEGPVKIGAILPLTGNAADYGQAARRGVELAVEKLKNEKGLDLDVIFEDSQMDPKKAVDAAQKLLNIDGVKYIAGFSSGESLSVCPLTEAKKAIFLSPGSSPEITTKCGEYNFRNMPSDIYQGKEMADKIYAKGYKNVAIFYINNDYGLGLKDEFVKNFKGSVVATETHKAADSDFRTQLTKIKSANPDAIMLISHLAEGSVFLRQKGELGMNQPVFCSETLKDPKLIEKVGAKSLENVYVIFISQYDGREFQEFKNAYLQKYREQFGAFSDYIHDNVLLIGNAVDQCGNNVECVKEKIYTTETIGATGPISFDRNGDRINKPYTLYKIQNNDFVSAE